MDDTLSDLFKQLRTASFDTYASVLTEVRVRLQAGATIVLDDDELLFVLRPCLWWLHNPGFQDVMDKAEAAMQCVMRHDAVLNPPPCFPGTPVVALTTFLVRYIEEGLFDQTGWVILPQLPELCAASNAEELADKLTAIGEDGEALRVLASLMRKIAKTKYETPRVLEQLGDQQLDWLTKFIHDMPESDQRIILGAYDSCPGSACAIAFLEDFIETTADDQLRDLADYCLDAARTEAV